MSDTTKVWIIGLIGGILIGLMIGYGIGYRVGYNKCETDIEQKIINMIEQSGVLNNQFVRPAIPPEWMPKK